MSESEGREWARFGAMLWVRVDLAFQANYLCKLMECRVDPEFPSARIGCGC